MLKLALPSISMPVLIDCFELNMLLHTVNNVVAVCVILQGRQFNWKLCFSNDYKKPNILMLISEIIQILQTDEG